MVREVTVQKTGGGQLFVYIPKAIERHFGIKEGQKVYVDWDESDPTNPKLVYYLRNPPAQPVEHAHGRDKKETVAKEA